MDPQPLPPHPATIPNPSTTAATTSQHNYPDSADSSPRSRHPETWDDSLPPVPGAKLRLMCSYGGHIIPRPHDKSLCYVGGDTRIVVVDRHSSLLELSSRLSRTFLHGRQFTLKYQLPNENLDSLVSVTTDEDLENMIEEYERTTSASPLKPSRLRLFLFPAKPETAASMGSLLDDAKSETWFVDALNGAGFLPRGLSDSAAIDCLLEVDGLANRDSCTDLEAQNESLGVNKQVKNVHNVESTMSDWPMAETSNSSFGSSSSSPSMSNLPPIKVRVEDGGARLQDQMVGLDEQISQLSFATTVQKQDEGFVMLSAPPPLSVDIGTPAAASAAAGNSTVVSGEHPSRVFSDDERSDLVAPSGFRKPPLPLQPMQRKLGHDAYSLPSPDSKHAGDHNLPSPDSVASDVSVASATSLSKHTSNQDPTPVATSESKSPAGLISAANNISNPTFQTQLQKVENSMYMSPPPQNQQQQQQQQQFFHSGMHYIHHPVTGPVPMSSYYPMYAPPSQQPIHQHMDQQYPMYYFPITQTQPYNLTMQSNISDATITASSQAMNPANPATVASPAAYQETNPPLYPTKTAAPTKPEMAASVYRTAATTNPSLVQLPSNQFQQQYVNLSRMAHPLQSNAGANYGFEYARPTHDQVYYTQQPLPPQYQTMTNSVAAVLLSQASAQQPADNTKQQSRPSQPL